MINKNVHMFLAREFASLSTSFFLCCNFHQKSAICTSWCTGFISIILRNFDFQIFGMFIFSHFNCFLHSICQRRRMMGEGARGRTPGRTPSDFGPALTTPPPFLAPTLQIAPPDFQTFRHSILILLIGKSHRSMSS